MSTKRLPYNHPWNRFKDKLRNHWQSFIFCCLLLVGWLIRILFTGWYFYLFHPKTYVIRAGDIILDQSNACENRGKAHWVWWNRYYCNAGIRAAQYNEPDDLVTFTERDHPFFFTEILYVRSKAYKARVIGETIKMYSVD